MKKFSIFFIIFAAILFMAGNVYAYNSYYNNYYIGLNGGVADTSFGHGLSSKSGGTFNLTLGKDFNNNNIVIGVGALLGYADNGSYSQYNFNVHSAYYGAFIKGGYNFQGLMPFVKIGYVGYSYVSSNSSNSNVYGVSSKGGLLYGAGVEYMFNPTWGVTVQYLGASLSSSIRENNYLVGIDLNF